MKESTYQSVGKSLSSPTLWVIFGGGYHSLRVCRSLWHPQRPGPSLALDLLGTHHCSHRDVGRAGYHHD